MSDQRIAQPIRLVDTSGGTPNTSKIDSSGNLSVGLNAVGSVILPVSGTFWQTTQPVSGTFWQTTQPVSGTVTANAGSGTMNVVGTGTAGTPGTSVLTIQGISGGTAIPVSGTFWQATQPVSGTVTANAGTGTFAISAASLPLPSGASTAVAQASTTSGQSGSLIQGAVTTAAPTYTTAQTSPLSLTTAGALRVDASGTTQPVSGSVTVSGTVTANAGSGTFAISASALPLPSGAATAVTQGSTTSGQSGTLIQGAVTTASPTYTTAQSSPISLTTAGAIRVDSSATTQPVSGTFWQATQPVSGTVTANAGTGTFAISATALPLPTGAAADATVAKLNVAQGAATSTNTGPMMQGVATTAAPSYTTATINPLSLDTAGNLRVNVVAGGGSSGVVSQSTATSGELGMLIQGAVTTAAPTYTTGNTNPLSLTTAGAVRVDASATTQPVSGTFWQATQPVSGTVTANAGTGNFNVVGTGSAGSPAAGVVTVQGAASGTALNVAVTGTPDSPANPVYIRNTSASLAAGVATTTAIQTTDLVSGTYYCAGFDASSTVPLKVELYTVTGGTQATNPITTVFCQAGSFIQWKPPHRQFIPIVSAGAAGEDGFRLIITNLDTSEAADVYGTIYYQTN